MHSSSVGRSGRVTTSRGYPGRLGTNSEDLNMVIESQSDSQPQLQTPSPYSRDNHFGDDAPSGDEPGGHDSFSGTAKSEWVAKQLLKDGIGRLDPIVLSEDPTQCPKDCEEFDEEGECEHLSWMLHDAETSAELSEPRHYVRESPNQILTSSGLYERRENTECGYLISGGAIPDRPAEEFLSIVDDWLTYLKQPSGEFTIRDSEAADLQHRARELKRSGELHDVQILRKLIEKADTKST